MSDAKAAKKPTSLLDKMMSADPRSWNKYLALLYVVQGIIILVVSLNRNFPITTSFLGLDTLQTQAQGHTVLATGTQHLLDVNLTYLVAAYLFLSAVAHGLAATKLRSFYERDLKRGVNKIRWIEYALNTSIMVVLVGLLAGVQDLSTLLLLFSSTAVMNLLGLVMETHNQGARKINWLNYVVGCISGVLPWVVLAIYFISGGLYGVVPPGFVYRASGTVFLLVIFVAVNMYLLYRKVGNWKQYVYGERVYMLLSFIAKTALAWQLFAGNLRP